MPDRPQRIVIAITGATGAVYGVRLLQALQDLRRSGSRPVETHLVVSDAAVLTLHQETGLARRDVEAMAHVVHKSGDIGAAIASGSFQSDGMIIALHASFKFGNIAGMAFWSMMMVTISGFVGRYLYAQIPRGITAAELSKKEMAEKEEALRKQLEEQKEAFGFAVEALYHLPTAQEVAHSSTIEAIISMIMIDCRRPFEASMVRLRSTGFFPWLFSFCGLRATGDYKLERAITVASTQSALSKRVMYLSKTHKMFELWHVIHRPFSYAFAILAIIHISLALFMGYRI